MTDHRIERLLGDAVSISSLEWIVHSIIRVVRSSESSAETVQKDVKLHAGLVAITDRASNAHVDDDPTKALACAAAELAAVLRISPGQSGFRTTR